MKLTKKPLGVKLPPYFDFVHFEQMAKILNKHKVRFVSCINSVGNTLIIDSDEEKKDIEKILAHEKNRVILNYIPSLDDQE